MGMQGSIARLIGPLGETGAISATAGCRVVMVSHVLTSNFGPPYLVTHIPRSTSSTGRVRVHYCIPATLLYYYMVRAPCLAVLQARASPPCCFDNSRASAFQQSSTILDFVFPLHHACSSVRSAAFPSLLSTPFSSTVYLPVAPVVRPPESDRHLVGPGQQLGLCNMP